MLAHLRANQGALLLPIPLALIAVAGGLLTGSGPALLVGAAVLMTIAALRVALLFVVLAEPLEGELLPARAVCVDVRDAHEQLESGAELPRLPAKPHSLS